MVYRCRRLIQSCRFAPGPTEGDVIPKSTNTVHSQDLEISGIISGSWETWTAWSGRSRCSSPPQFRASDLDIDALAKQNEDESSVPDTAEGEDAQATDNSENEDDESPEETTSSLEKAKVTLRAMKPHSARSSGADWANLAHFAFQLSTVRGPQTF